MFKDLYNYRELLKTNVRKDIRGKYKASFLGVLWSFINPLLQVVVYAIVFPYLMRQRMDNYVLYLVTGIIPWTYFQIVLAECVSCIKSNAGIIKKVYFPKVILPVSAMLSGFINFLISCLIIILFCLFYRVPLTGYIAIVPLIGLIEGLFVLGLGMIGGSLAAYLQDLEYIINFLVQLLFYGTPIIYDLNQFQSQSVLMQMVRLNPMTTLMQSYRDIFLYQKAPNFVGLFYVLLLAVGLDIVGYIVFKKLEKGFAEQF